MKTFEYVAVGCDGGCFSGEVEAADEAEARKLVEEKADESIVIRSINEVEG
jgi:type II secretory pathway component PulF